MTSQQKQIKTVKTALIFIEQHKAALIGKECTGNEYENAIKPAFLALDKLQEAFLVNPETYKPNQTKGV